MNENSYVIVCPVCRGLVRVKRYGVRVRCPHCGSILLVLFRNNVTVVVRGQVPFPPPDTKPALGAIGGLLLGVALGGLIGAILGLLIGGSLEASAKEEEEV